MTKVLLLMRHAKSDWDVSYDRDHDRPLAPRGVRSAQAIGRELAGSGDVPQTVISSTAVRAVGTARLAIEAGEWDSELRLETDFYGTGPDRVLSVAAGTDSGVDRLMLVGHEPTWSRMVVRITGVPAVMKTANVAIVDLDDDAWFGLPSARGTLRRMIVARELIE